MAWEGYITYGDVEIINVARTEAYLRNSGMLAAFRMIYGDVPLADYLEETYSTPSDGAPWADGDFPDTYDFYGAYPISIGGLESSSAVATVAENITDGGYVQPTRFASKGIVFNVLLIGSTDRAVDAGLRWLHHVLLNRTAWNPQLDGAPGRANDLAFLTSVPTQEDVDAGRVLLEDPLRRWTYYDTRCTIAPQVLAKQELSTCTGVLWNVTFTITAPNPKPYYDPINVVTEYPDNVTTAADPFGAEVTGSFYSTADALYVDESCAAPLYQPLNDPLCPAVLLPPGVPSVALNCLSLPLTFRRRWLRIPTGFSPRKGVAATSIYIESRNGSPVRNYRLRFYPYLEGDPTPDTADPCAFSHEILIPYLPTSITILPHLNEVTGPGGKRAEHLLTRSDGNPFDWPWLDTDVNWAVAIDHDASYVEPYLSLRYYTTNATHGIV